MWIHIYVYIVAHRVGINLYPVGFPGHFLLGCDLTQFASPTTTATVNLFTNEDNEENDDDEDEDDDNDDDGTIGNDKAVFADSFAGRFLSRNQCKALLRRHGSNMLFNNRV